MIPLQQSFGHVEYILRNYKYAQLREDDKDFSQVCPSEPGKNKELFTRLFKDMAAMIPRPIFILAVMKPIYWVIAKNAKKERRRSGYHGYTLTISKCFAI